MKALGHSFTILFGIGFILICLFGYIKGNATEDWPSTEGKVISLDLKRKWVVFQSDRSTGTGTKKRKYKAIITYGYNVAGIDYIADNYEINFLGFTDYLVGSKYYLENYLKIHEKYKPGKPLTVYYDPEDPGFALVAKGYQGYLPMYLLFGLIAIVFGGYKLMKSS